MANNAGKTVEEILRSKKADIRYTALDPDSPSWDEILDLTWEVDFFADGEVYVERFCSNGQIDDESASVELFAKHSVDAEPATVGVPNEEVPETKVFAKVRHE